MCDRDKCISILRENKARIQREFDVASMAVFGSVARETNTSGSDIDILVDMPPKIFQMSALKKFLETLLDNSVDLVRRHPHLTSKFLNQISRDAITIF